MRRRSRPSLPEPKTAAATKVGWLKWLLLDSPWWTRSVWHRLARLGLYLIGIYLGVLLMLLMLENWFLFHPDTALESWAPPPAGQDVRDVYLSSAEGSLHAWWTRPRDWSPDQGAVLYFHGNAGNLSHRGDVICHWRDELHQAVLIVDYPGYGRSEGSPTESGCYATGDAAHEWLTEKTGVPGSRIMLVGGSLGGTVATHLATTRPSRALVLVAAFTSFPDMAQKTFPWLPCRWLVRNQMDNLARVGRLKQPLFIAHSTSDALVPYTMAERLFAAAN